MIIRKFIEYEKQRAELDMEYLSVNILTGLFIAVFFLAFVYVLSEMIVKWRAKND